MFRTVSIIALIVVAAGCTPKVLTHAEALEMCRDQADAASGPQGNLGASTGTSGTRANVSISISDSFLRGDDPQMVFDTCMNELSSNGQILGVSP